MDIEKYIQTRPVVYHLTDRLNLEQIQDTSMLFPTATFYEEAGLPHKSRCLRHDSDVVSINGVKVHIRDQAPLHAGHMSLCHNTTYTEFIEFLNQHVYFWPGTCAGPNDYGIRHFARYRKRKEDSVVLACDSASLFQVNTEPRFSRYNSGSPRCSGGKRSPRCIDMFRLADDFVGTPSKVVEVTFRDAVQLSDVNVSWHNPEEFTHTTDTK